MMPRNSYPLVPGKNVLKNRQMSGLNLDQPNSADSGGQTKVLGPLQAAVLPQTGHAFEKGARSD